MKFSVTFIERNPEFNKEYAKEYHMGKESENNHKDLWKSRIDIVDDVKEFYIKQNQDFKLSGTLENGTTFNYIIPNMTILECLSPIGEITEVVVSKSLIKRTHSVYNEKYDITRFYFYLKFLKNAIIASNCIYIDKKDFPKELLAFTYGR
jgi:hypothetical protein